MSYFLGTTSQRAVYSFEREILNTSFQAQNLKLLFHLKNKD